MVGDGDGCCIGWGRQLVWWCGGMRDKMQDGREMRALSQLAREFKKGLELLCNFSKLGGNFRILEGVFKRGIFLRKIFKKIRVGPMI